MCGIFGYIGSKDALKVCLTGLKLLEYRGYDSAGIAGIENQTLLSIKEKGKIQTLEKKLQGKKRNFDLAIAHTRWATHGKPSQVNAHPHLDENNSIAIVHNGIIENYEQIRNMLKRKGVSFQSETDTEVIAQLISYYYTHDLQKAFQQSLQLLKGSWALAVIHQDYPDVIYAATRESPLVIGFNDEKTESWISSDANALLDRSLSIIYLKKDEIAKISKSTIKVFDSNSQIIPQKSEKLSSEYEIPTKGCFEHFMLKEIHEQPFTIEKAINSSCLDFLNEISQKELKNISQILITACGTSLHAGWIAAKLLEEKAHIPTKVEISSELRYKNFILLPNTLVIAISQSGETADTIAAVRKAKEKGAKILGICNVKNSALTRESDHVLYLKAGPEISVCSTKAFTSQITVLILFTLCMARLRHQDSEELLVELKKIPSQIQTLLKHSSEIQELAHKYSHYKNFFFLGRGYMYETCLEAALKLKEISYLNANGYPAGEMKHGPIALVDHNLPIIAFCANQKTFEKMINNLMEVKARSAPILAIAPTNLEEVLSVTKDVIWLPPTIDEMAVFPATIAGQLFAYYIAKKLGCEIDQPKNLAKSVTVE